MIYCFHHYDRWIRGGLEYGQAYRAKILRNIKLDAKFIFATTFPTDVFQQEIHNMGFLDSEVLWLYGYFSDCKISPITYTLEQLEDTFEDKNYVFSRDNNIVKYEFPGRNSYYIVHMMDTTNDYIHRVTMISNGCLLRQDYYTYCRIYSEYYAPLNNQAHLYLRRYFNEDGTIAYEELQDNNIVMYKFPNRILYSREELVGYMISCLKLTEKDTVLIDSSLGSIDPAVIVQKASSAKIGFVIHENHFIEGDTDHEHILWYNHYENTFSHFEKVNFFITSTDAQSALLRQQFLEYQGSTPMVATIPVGGLDKLEIAENIRKKHSLITASRLEAEKHIDLLVEAVAEARKWITDLSLDIYGRGRKEGELREQIERLNCGDYICLCGHQRLDKLYKKYEAYVSASVGETFGITLMEAVGSGLSIIGFDVPYGNQVFIDDGSNGYVVPWNSRMHRKEHVQNLACAIVRLFTEADLEKFQEHSYEKARSYLTEEIEKRWKEILT